MKTMTCEREREARLTRLQSALHSYLRANSGETITREQLCAAVWQMNYYSSRTVDQTVSVVRKHLAEDERIVTVFGVGYRHELHSSGLPRHSLARGTAEEQMAGSRC
jgi:DNA-binding response OmpR family regulator